MLGQLKAQQSSQMRGSHAALASAGSSCPGNQQTVSCTSFNQPMVAQKAVPGGPRYTWQYDESHQRLKEVKDRVGPGGSAQPRTTWFLHPDNQGGLAFEREISGSSATQTAANRHYLSAGGMVLAWGCW